MSALTCELNPNASAKFVTQYGKLACFARAACLLVAEWQEGLQYCGKEGCLLGINLFCAARFAILSCVLQTGGVRT